MYVMFDPFFFVFFEGCFNDIHIFRDASVAYIYPSYMPKKKKMVKN